MRYKRKTKLCFC